VGACPEGDNESFQYPHYILGTRRCPKCEGNGSYISSRSRVGAYSHYEEKVEVRCNECEGRGRVRETKKESCKYCEKHPRGVCGDCKGNGATFIVETLPIRVSARQTFEVKEEKDKVIFPAESASVQVQGFPVQSIPLLGKPVPKHELIEDVYLTEEHLKNYNDEVDEMGLEDSFKLSPSQMQSIVQTMNKSTLLYASNRSMKLRWQTLSIEFRPLHQIKYGRSSSPAQSQSELASSLESLWLIGVDKIPWQADS
jgi:hypothetical protein